MGITSNYQPYNSSLLIQEHFGRWVPDATGIQEHNYWGLNYINDRFIL